MAGYSPLRIAGMSSGLVQERENFLIPDDAYPNLENAYVWRERILRKKGYQLLGRLRRKIGTTNGSGNLVVAITPTPIQPGIASFVVGSDNFQDWGGASPVTLRTNSSGSAVLDRATGILTITGSQAGADVWYYPGLPVMGIRTRELQNSANDQTIFFDQNYAYRFNSVTGQFEEFPAPATWNASAEGVDGAHFFWSTNYWVSQVKVPNDPMTNLFTTSGVKLFWETNNTGEKGNTQDPIRITDGTTWVDFFPSVAPWSQIDSTNFLVNALAFLPYRGRMVMFNTWEGTNTTSAQNYFNRIRWSTIGNPFIPYSAGPPATGSWRDDIRGQGGYLDIPTSEDIVAVGFVRDNLVIYCERSTWQLRYTGRSIAPFQIERVNSELGAEGTFSAVQFDTSLVGIGDKGVVECDSYKSERIDIKIPDFVFGFNDINNGPVRVHGVRDFINRLAFWTVPLAASYDARTTSSKKIFPNRRLLYNYENDSWTLFTDSLTTLGTFQSVTSRNWINTPIPWIQCNFPWINKLSTVPSIVGGNQQGFVEYLDELTSNDVSLMVADITRNSPNPTIITSPNHNLTTGSVISITGIQPGQPFSASLNNPTTSVITNISQSNPAQVTSTSHGLSTGDSVQIFGVVGMTQINGLKSTITRVSVNRFNLDSIDSTSFSAYVSGGIWQNLAVNVFGIVLNSVEPENKFMIYYYDPVSQKFDIPQINTAGPAYQGGAQISVVENFNITSKKFNFLDEGQAIQLGYIDILMAATGKDNPGAISLNMYLDYDDVETSNTLPNNDINDDSLNPVPDMFFNATIPTTQSSLSNIGGTKFWQRVYCATRANFLTIQYTFSNAQMAGREQQQPVQIDAQVLWIRKGGRMTSI